MPMLHRLCRILAGLVAIALAGAALGQTRLENTARLTYRVGDGEHVVLSNTVTLDVAANRRPTRLSFHLLPYGVQLAGLGCETASGIVALPAAIDEAMLAASPETRRLDLTQSVVFALAAPGDNRDPGAREDVLIDLATPARTLQVRLHETGPNTGIFAGALPGRRPEGATADGAAADPCDPHLRRDDLLTLRYPGSADSLPSSASILVDPAGFVFDSRTGEPVDGATVSLIDEQGRPVRVYGDDGVSAYPATVVTGQETHDASGRAYPAGAGYYRFPFAPAGRYVLKVTPPAGYTAPSTADPQALARLRNADGSSYTIVDASFGRPFVFDQSDPLLIDIPVDRARGTVLLTKTASVREAAPGDTVQYRLAVANRDGTATGAVDVTDTLPVGLRYLPHTTHGAPEPTVGADGRTLVFRLASLAAGGASEVSYVVAVAPGAPVGEAVNRARITGPGVTGNEADAAVRVRPLLFTDALTIIGRVTEGSCGDPADHRRGVAGVRLLMEDGSYVVTDRDGLYHFEGVRTGRHVVQIDVAALPVSHRPVACDLDTRQAGSAISRFVEGQGGTLQRVDFQLAPTGLAAVAAALPVQPPTDAAAAGDRDWAAGEQPGIAWLFPAPDHNPRAPAVRVAIKHAPGQHVALSVNGAPSDPLAFDATDTGAPGVAVSRWSGIPLVSGDNRLEARVTAADGTLVRTLARTVHLSRPAVRAVLVPERSRLVADGVTAPLVAVRVTDQDGRPVRAGALVPFRVDQPYTAQVDAALRQARQRAGGERAAPVARVVGDDGLAFLVLDPTTQAGAVHAIVTLAQEKQVRVSDIRAWLSAGAKQWVVVGFGAGTIGYRTLADHAQPLPRRRGDRLAVDGQLALYAKGRVKGAWLLTLAYDSDRRPAPDRGLLGTIDPDRYYTVYGDGADQAYDAPTRRKLYVRLERRAFYALLGDFETGLTETELTRYNRTLNGVRAGYGDAHLRASGFAATADQRYVRDEIRGNGLSGPYRLSGRGIVPNSDKLRIEVRDRFRSELIRSTRQLTRHIDYDIDPDAGTLRFREPVLSRDAALDPVFIVAEYEVEAGHNHQIVAAGHATVLLAGGAGEIGAGVIRDGAAAGATVAGLDARLRLDAHTVLRAEAATGGRDGLGGAFAYLAEVERHDSRLDLLLYHRRQDGGFGAGQQNIVEAGTAKVGLDGRWRLTDQLSLTGTAWYQDQLAGPGRRTAADLKLELRRTLGTVFIGGQYVDDIGQDGVGRRSRLLTLGGTQALLGGRLEIGAQTQVAPDGVDDSVDFPVRHQLTANYRIRNGVRLIGSYELAQAEHYSIGSARIGFDVAPWTGVKLMSTLSQQSVGENAARTYAQYGLSQSLQLGSRWTLDGTLDAASVLAGRLPEGVRVGRFEPTAVGAADQGAIDGAFVAATLGAAYRVERWSWNGRLEWRSGGEGWRVGLVSNLVRTLGEGRSIAASVKAFRLVDAAGVGATSIAADAAAAWRPLDSRWSLLERLQFRHDAAGAGLAVGNALGVAAEVADGQATTRLVNNVALNYRGGPEGSRHGIEGTVYYGAKYVRGRYGDERLDGFIDVIGFDIRRDLGRRLDVGVQGSVQHGWSQRAVAFSGGPSVGVSPATNLWVSAGVNIAGYRDRDFDADRYTRAGPYVTMRLKFDQLSLARLGR